MWHYIFYPNFIKFLQYNLHFNGSHQNKRLPALLPVYQKLYRRDFSSKLNPRRKPPLRLELNPAILKEHSNCYIIVLTQNNLFYPIRLKVQNWSKLYKFPLQRAFHITNGPERL